MSASGPTILYVRLPGLLAAAAREQHGMLDAVPVAVALGRTIRDACPEAIRRGVKISAPEIQARRLCPFLLCVAQEQIDHRTLARWTCRFLDILAALSPAVQPDGPDAAYIDLSAGGEDSLPNGRVLRSAWDILGTGFPPVLGAGRSRVAARACAECHLPAGRFREAQVRWLWPEETDIIARLHRLGLATFGEVADIGESALVYQFGKKGRLLYHRAIGLDFTPVKALWPPHRVEAKADFSLEPIADDRYLNEALKRLAARVSGDLGRASRHARRLRLSVRIEGQGERSVEWILPMPVQRERDVYGALRRLRSLIDITAAVLGLTVTAEDIDLPPAATASLFDDRAAERKLALAATRQRLHSRFGQRSLRTLAELPVSPSETRHDLRKARRGA